MVEFGGRYYIDPAQVEYISETDRAGAIVADSHPYDLTVHLLSGKSLRLCYPTKVARDNEKRKLITAIQRERTNYEEAMLCKLRSIQGAAIKLTKAAGYVSSVAKNKACTLTGNYWLYDGILIRGRYRVTNTAARCGKKPVGNNVTAWVDAKDCVIVG